MTTTPARLFAATCLVVTALLSVVSVLLQPEFSADPAERLAAIDAAGASGVVSLLTFVLAQLPFMVAAVAIALLARPADRPDSPSRAAPWPSSAASGTPSSAASASPTSRCPATSPTGPRSPRS